MKYAADFKDSARAALRGKWGIAVLVGLLAALLGGVSGSGPQVNFTYNGSGPDLNLQYGGQTIYSLGNGLSPTLRGLVLGGAVYLVLLALIVGVAYFILGSVVSVGYARFNLDLPGTEKPSVSPLFAYFPQWKTLALTKLRVTVTVLLWSLLLIVPGIMAGYSYAMTDYLLAENPELTPGEAMAQSKALMDGNRWRLFCLQLSFIGWSILASLTFGIGELFLTPYVSAAEAAFYRDLTAPAGPEGAAFGEFG